MFSPPLPPDETYLGAICVALGVSGALWLLNARPAWHALVMGLVLVCIGWMTFNIHVNTLEGASIEQQLTAQTPPATNHLVLGLYLLAFSAWLGLLRNWMGEKTRIFLILMLWGTVLFSVVIHLVRPTSLMDFPTEKEAFLALLDHNAIMNTLTTVTMITVTLTVLCILIAPLIWRYRFKPVTSP